MARTAALMVAPRNWLWFSVPVLPTPLEKYTSAFFSGRDASILAADSSAPSLRSVLKILNSVSSAWKASPVSAALSSSAATPSAARSLPSPMRKPFTTAFRRSRSAVKSSHACSLVEKLMMETMSRGQLGVDELGGGVLPPPSFAAMDEKWRKDTA